MASQPPPLPQSQHLRVATLFNACLPGAGLVLLGRRVLGCALATAFLSCFLAVLTIFLAGYARYLSFATSDQLMQGSQLEDAGSMFHPRWLAGLALAGGLIYVSSAILFARAKRRAAAHPPNRPEQSLS
jgi:hypothetical protein